MRDPVRLASTGRPKGWTDHLAWDTASKQMKSAVDDSNLPKTSDTQPVSRAAIIVSLGARTLRAWLKEPHSNPQAFHDWPDSPLTRRGTRDLPAIIAYESDSQSSTWGFSVPEDHP